LANPVYVGKTLVFTPHLAAGFGNPAEHHGNSQRADFFDGLFETIIEYVEKHNASAGLSISHKQYEEEDDNTDNGTGYKKREKLLEVLAKVPDVEPEEFDKL
jgi:hypothetical protein